MPAVAEKPTRRQVILEALARELEASPGKRITTANLARAVGVSEAALYRHFPSKEKMFQALIEFCEESVFALVGRILSDEADAARRCERILQVLLVFSERNPGITRIMHGDVLTGEAERLRARVGQFYDRLEAQIKQVIRDAGLVPGADHVRNPAAAAGLLMAVAQGRIDQYVRSDFRRKPMDAWDEQWPLIVRGVFG